MNMTNLILIATNLPILIVAIYAGYHFTHFKKELRIFSGFLFLSAFVQLTSLSLYLFEANNMPLLHAYTMIGGFILILFYREVFRNYLSGKVLLIIAFTFLIFSLLNSIFIEEVFAFNTIGLTVQATIIVVLSLSTFNLLMQEKVAFQNEQLHKGINWINSGLFIYFCSNLLLYYFGDYLSKSSVPAQAFRYIWMLHSLFTITMYTFFFIGLWKTSKD